ncbi:hypothetical protein R50073_43120 [Maricurvus nonylphenolicus]|uniref:arylsulfatase B n=1 Tax=Maricurvus nonylphenolicus TaxID=1008307 RepID=UPI0036F31722
MFNKNITFLFLLTLLALNISCSVSANETTKPNIVVILVDDMGWNDVGYHGSEINTPNIDQLAADGIELDRFYVQPSCSPTRAALLSGKSPQTLGIYSPFSKQNPKGLPLSEKLLPQYFQENGYQTFLTGKWHLGFQQPEYHPMARGFDYFYGHVTGGIGYWDHVHGGHLDWQRNGKTLRENGYSTHLIANDIERLIEDRNKTQPMFLFAAFNAPHLPNEAPKETINKYSHISDENRRIHAAMVTELDSAIGRIKDALKREGILDNTLIWFMSDNGGLNQHAISPPLVKVAKGLDTVFDGSAPFTFLEFIRTNVLDGGADNYPFRKGKQSVYEGGARVPSVLHWPEKLSPRKLSHFTTVQDVLPTLLSATGLDIPSGIHGVNTWPQLSNSETVESHKPSDYLINAADGEALYRFPWKLIALSSGEYELYKLDRDPEEKENLVGKKPSKVDELKAALDSWPRSESIHVPIYKVMLDPDFFGGEERLPPIATETNRL